MELELKYYKHYLLTKAKVKAVNVGLGELSTMNLVGIKADRLILENDAGVILERRPEDCRLLLYPLSQLTQEIEHNGERFVPLEKIALQGKEGYRLTKVVKILRGTGLLYYISSGVMGHDNETKFDRQTKSFRRHGQIVPYELNQKLYEWHFDVFGLIENGLAIEKR